MRNCEWVISHAFNSPPLLPSQRLTGSLARYIFELSSGHSPPNLKKGHSHLLGTIAKMRVPTNNVETEVMGGRQSSSSIISHASTATSAEMPKYPRKRVSLGELGSNVPAMCQASGQSVPSPFVPHNRHPLRKSFTAARQNN